MQDIVLYSNNCPRCNVLKAKVQRTGLPFRVVDDVDAMEQLGITSVPYLCVDGQMMDFPTACKWVNILENT